MHIILNNSSMVPIYEQLVEQLRNEIISGHLKENDLLPSVRSLSNEVKISALTVKKAYDFLEKEGFVVTVHGKGTYVSGANHELAAESRRKEIENELAAVLDKAAGFGMKADEVHQLVDILMEV